MISLKNTIFLLLVILFPLKAKTSFFEELPFELKKNVMYHLDTKDKRAFAQTSKLMYDIIKPQLVNYTYKPPANNNLNDILPFYQHSYIKKLKYLKEIFHLMMSYC